MLLFCVGIVHTNLYNCISWFLARILYLELFDIASHACGWRQERHPVVKTLLQYSSLTYEGKVQPYRKMDYKPIIYIYIYTGKGRHSHLTASWTNLPSPLPTITYCFNGRIFIIKENSTKKETYKTWMNIRLNIPNGIQKYIHYVHADMLTS